MKVTYPIFQKNGSKSVSIGSMSITGGSVTIEGKMDEIIKFTEYLEQKYDLA